MCKYFLRLTVNFIYSTIKLLILSCCILATYNYGIIIDIKKTLKGITINALYNIYRKSWRAATRNPVEALRYEYLILILVETARLLRLPLCGILAMTGEVN
jgi:hypothetical protein